MPPKSSASKVRNHRAKLRREGLRPIQMWVPDVNNPKIREQMRREARMIAQSPQKKDDLAFVEALRNELWDEGFFDK